MKIVHRVFLLLLLLGAAAIAIADNPSPAITVSGSSVEVSGLTPGAEVVIFGIIRTDRAFVAHVGSVGEILVDSDRDGRVTLARSEPIPHASVFVAVDVRNGNAVSANGAGTDVRAIDPLPPGALKRGRSGKVDALAFDRFGLALLYVHAGRAWTWSVRDGGADDDDGELRADGKVRSSAAKARAVHEDRSGFSEFGPGGTLVLIDPATLEVGIVRVDAGRMAGAQ